MFKGFEKIKSLFEEHTAQSAVAYFLVITISLLIIFWFLVLSGHTVDSAPIYEGF